ncbi:MAG: hypothetical protein JKY42_09225 [Flavobacteriales bacterium]|nr:hypothetical protein [Flavobacteriales bacterium]
MKRSNTVLLLITVVLILSIQSCKRKGCTDSKATNYNKEAKKDNGSCIYTPEAADTTLIPIDTSTVIGFSILEKLPGIWNGPVTSPTALGSYPEWIVDFRPISPSQISAKNELDSLNDIFMSFFIVLHNNEYKVAFRNGGGFAGFSRSAYLFIDSISETSSQSFYRFSDPVAGETRVYTDLIFKDDSLKMHTYTNQYNTLLEPVTHMTWNADKRDATSAQDAITLFDFPQVELTKDFSSTFDNVSEAVFYAVADDPYLETEQPYLGNSIIDIDITNPSTIDTSKKVLIIITTQPIFTGVSNLNYRSRYVFVSAATPTGFNFNYMHPGSYYLNAIYDNDGDYSFSSGDYMNSSFDVPFTLTEKGTSTTSVTIDFMIP